MDFFGIIDSFELSNLQNIYYVSMVFMTLISLNID